MFSKFIKLIRSSLILSVSGKYKREFEIGINRINIVRGKITAVTFIISEILILIVSLLAKKEAFFTPPTLYYGTMYILIIIIMVIHLLVFIKLGKNIPKYRTSILVAGISFASFILLWCAWISLLDQLSSGGQIIVYTVAIISVAVAPFYKPIALLFIYLIIHTLFLTLMVYFQKSSGIIFGDCVNSTSFLIISWVISLMRYKNQVEVFSNKKIMQEKSDELKKVNKELGEANQKLEKLSQADGLTGIFNRSVFDKTIKIEWDRCKRHFTSLSLIMIDIDFFKSFNDKYGHQAGDDCIMQVARALSECARRSSDIVARYGGEEFAIILPHME
ncbi:MAG: hypothetical protein K0R09_2327 [Clostridiales bacterium]|nr:hypothetical protein [Clostridiales bacterium]